MGVLSEMYEAQVEMPSVPQSQTTPFHTAIHPTIVRGTMLLSPSFHNLKLSSLLMNILQLNHTKHINCLKQQQTIL